MSLAPHSFMCLLFAFLIALQLHRRSSYPAMSRRRQSLTTAMVASATFHARQYARRGSRFDTSATSFQNLQRRRKQRGKQKH